MDEKTCIKCNTNSGTPNIQMIDNGERKHAFVCDQCLGKSIENIMDSFFERMESSPTNIKDFLFGLDMGTPAFATANSVPPPVVEEETIKQKQPKTPALEKFGRNLTELAKNKDLNPVIGRDNEMEQMTEILTRYTKNNVILIGSPGVGKTAIVEGLASKLLDIMPTHQVYELDLTSLVSGTQYRGQFEARINAILTEIKENDIILFIDEFHSVVGTGSAEGSLDAANILKPALARGEIQVIGATTNDEYRQRIEKDGALTRRFSKVYVEEPTLEETFEILAGYKPVLEKYHSIKISDDTIKATIDLADRYIHDGLMPDKALDLLDQSCAKARNQDTSGELSQLRNSLKVAVEREEFDYAASIKEKIDELSQDLSVEVVADVISLKTGIKNINVNHWDNLKALPDNLAKEVVGQDHALKAVSNSIQRAAAKLNHNAGPMGVFLFLGPTGVGKTQLAKSLANQLFNDESSILRIDMSEYREAHTVSRLIGSPPGYVGYGQGGQLTEPVRRRPYQVILLDEVEKAHPQIWNVFLQLFDDGRLTDGEGRVVNFKDTVIIMTSNLGSKAANSIGFTDEVTSKQEKFARDTFPPELWNRIDDIITFNPLNSETMEKITEMLLSKLAVVLLNEHGIKLNYKTAVKTIAQKGFDENLGARPLTRVLRKEVENKITDLIMDNVKNTTITLDKNLKLTVK